MVLAPANERKQPPRGRVLEFLPRWAGPALYRRPAFYCGMSAGAPFMRSPRRSCATELRAAARCDASSSARATKASHFARAARSRPAEAQPRGKLLCTASRSPRSRCSGARTAAAFPLEAAVPLSLARLRVCEVALDRSSSFTCPVGRVWRTRPSSLRRRPRGGAAARPPCAASRGRKLHCNQSVRGSSCCTTHS